MTHLFLESAEGRLLQAGWGWVGAARFRTDAMSSSEAFHRWMTWAESGLYAGTLGDPDRHGPWRSADVGLHLFDRVAPAVADHAFRSWLVVAGQGRDETGRREDLVQVASLVERALALADESEVHLVSRTAEQCQEMTSPAPGAMTGFVEVFALRADRRGFVVITATDDV